MSSMHSSRVRRHQRYDEEDDVSPVARPDDRRSESYTRTAHHHSNHHSRTDAYADSSNRGYPAASSHHRHTDDWRSAEPSYTATTRERYRSDGYDHSRHDEYHEQPNNWPTRPTKHVGYSREWTTREDAGQKASSYSENRTYAAESRFEKTSRKTHAEWSRDESRPERERTRYNRDERYSNHQPFEREWRTRDEVRAEEVTRSRRSTGWAEPIEDRRQWPNSSHEKSKERSKELEQPSEPTGRQWEPAPSWKNREQTDHIDYATSTPYQAHNRYNKKALKAKKKAQLVVHKREARKDEMNNWSKRERVDPYPTRDTETSYKDREHVSISTTKRRQDYSPGSRSRSPAHSSYSHRSRSRSFSPSRDVREAHPHHKNMVYKHSDTKHNDVRGRSPVASEKLVELSNRPRRPSLSSASSRSRSRSTSEESDIKRKAKHRLPTATSLRDIERQAKTMQLKVKQAQRQRKLAASDGVRGESTFVVERKASTSLPVPPHEAGSNSRDEDKEAMPPPTSAVSANPSDPVPHLRTSPIITTEKHVNGFKRNAGFKPIGGIRPVASASVKHFFPEDDETDGVSKEEKPSDIPASPSASPRNIRDAAQAQAPYGKHRDTDMQEDSNTNEISEKDAIEVDDHVTVGVAGEGEPALGTSDSPAQNGHHERRRERDSRDQLYAIVGQVGEGTFGKVYKARNNVSGVHVALKRIRMETEREGFPVTAMREIKLLQSLRHSNVVQLTEMMVHRGSVYMVFEYMDHDLRGVLSQTQFTFSDAHLKSLCQQMLQGLSYLHRKSVIHRDIKGSNILLNNQGVVKLADFGLARFYQKRRRADYTNRVITLFYRPPELLLGTTVYGPEVDMWSAGCVMLELFCKKEVFQGSDEIHQLDAVYNIMGTPSTEEWPGLVDMPWYELVKPKHKIRNRFRDLFRKWLPPAGLDLAERLLTYDPVRRATADQALEAPYFTEESPPPLLPELSSLQGEWHEYESKRARKRRRLEGAPSSNSSAPQN